MSTIQILYRGSLSSCNYHCDYCPFAKTTNSRAELDKDKFEVNRFVGWAADTSQTLGIFFTPWGEAIIHEWYRSAMVKLSWMPHIKRVVIQTNLSCKLEDFLEGNRDSIAYWATFHPTQTSLSRFIDRCVWLHENNFRFSVGVVGLRQHFQSISTLREQLPAEVYLWINSYKREENYYQDAELEFLNSVDPYFHINRKRYPSIGLPCNAGSQSFTVDGEGDARRCHFINDLIGNIYREDIFRKLIARNCTNQTCGCHIGYVHRPEGNFQQLFGANLLERVPHRWPEKDAAFAVKH